MDKNNKDIPQLAPENAAELLDNIFAESGLEPNTVPMEALSAYTSYRNDRRKVIRWLRILLVILILLVPLLLIKPGFSVEDVSVAGSSQPRYLLRVHTWLPVYKVTAVQRNRNVAVTRQSPRVYLIEPVRNGKLDLAVILFNRQFSGMSVEVTGADNISPVLVSSRIEDDYVYLYAEDAGTGIDYEGIYSVSRTGETVYPEGFDEEEGYVVFRYPEEACDVYIPDHIGNTLHLTMRPE